jgi:hypothetical protein
MRHLFETEYLEASTSSTNTALSSKANKINAVKSATRSKLDADFDDDDDNDVDEIERYLSEKPANKEMDVLAWWKVNMNNQHIGYCIELLLT